MEYLVKMSRSYFTPDVVDTLFRSYLKEVRRNWMHFCSCAHSEPLLISMYFYTSVKVIYRDKHCRLSLLFFLPQLRLCFLLLLVFNFNFLFWRSQGRIAMPS